MTSTWPPSSALSAGAPLWYGTAVAGSLPSTLKTYSLAMRADDPPKPKLMGLPFAAAMNSGSERAGLPALTAIAMLSRAENAIGASSPIE